MDPESLYVVCNGAAGSHRVHVLKWPNQNPLAERTPVVCVHGLTRMGHDFSDIAAHLSLTRDVYSITMPGRGKSDWLSDPMQYTYPTYVTDCLFIVREVLKLPEVDWLGTSMGGLIGMWIASLDVKSDFCAANGSEGPSLMRKIVLNDIGPFLPLTAIQRIAFYAGRTQDFNTIEEADRHCRAIYADFGIKTDKDWRFFAEHTVRLRDASVPSLMSDGTTGPAPARAKFTLHYDPRIAKVFADVKEDVSLWPMYDAIKCPTLLLRGARSDVLSKPIAEEMAQRGPKAKLVTFENCGHAPALIDPAQIKVVEDFLG